MSLTVKLIKGAVLAGGALLLSDTANRSVFKMATSGNVTKKYSGERFNYSQGKINYIKKGTGSPVLLVHDLSPYNSLYEWSKIINSLAKDHTVYAIDLLGCGHSSKPAIHYTSFMFTQIIYTFIESVIKEKTTVIASGTSCAFAIMASAGFTDKISRVICVNPPDISTITARPGNSALIPRLLTTAPVTGAYMYNTMMSKGSLAAIVAKNFRSLKNDVSRETLDVFYENAHIGGPANRHLLNSMNSGYLWADLRHGAEKCPDMKIIYSGDISDAARIAGEYRELNSSVVTAAVFGALKYPQLEKPTLFLKSLNRMIKA